MNTNWSQIKQLIYKELDDGLSQTIKMATKTIKEIKDSRNNDTKSSAGDKYETGREMMQIEMDKNEIQLNNAILLRQKLSQIELDKNPEKVEFGALVLTNQGTYFISIGVGKIEINKGVYYAISLASPIGKLLFDKKIGEKIEFRGREFVIKNII